MQSSFYTIKELRKLGLKSFGKNVLISRKCSIYGAHNISIGNNVRVDDFCILSGKIDVGSYVHIAAYSGLYAGSAGIFLKDFSGISSNCRIYAISDDYFNGLTNPMIPDRYRNIVSKPVIFNKHCVVGSGTTVLPGVELGEGSSIGAMSLLMKSTQPWKVYFGVPARIIGDRNKNILNLEQEFLNEIEEINE